MKGSVLLVVLGAIGSVTGAAVPPPSATPAKLIVNGNTSTAVDIKVVKVGQEVPDTYSGKQFAPTKGFEFYVSEHYALKSQMGDAFSRHVLEISELAYPHWVELTGLEPPSPNRRMAIIYAKNRNELNRAMKDDIHTTWTGGGGGITLWNNLAAYNYPSGTLKYHQRALIIHENLHVLQVVAGTGTMGTEGFTYAGEQHVYDEQKKQLTVAIFDHAPINNWIEAGLRELQNPKTFVPIQDFFAKGGWYRGGGSSVFMQFFWTDPDRLMKWRLLRDEYYASQFRDRPISRVAEEIFGPLEKLNAEWKAWLAQRRTTFHHVDWGWEQSGNTLWAYGFPWNKKYWSQMDLRYAPQEKVQHDPLRMDYPATSMPPIVGPVQRGVEEPSVGYVVANVGGGCWGGFGLGVEGRSTCHVVIRGNRHLVIDGSSFGIARKEIPLTAEVNAAAAKSSGRYGVTMKIRKNRLEVIVRAGKADAIKEMKASVPINQTQYKRLISKHLSVIGRNGYPAITPWIDDARKSPPNLTKPAPANRWRYAGLDPMFTLYKAAYFLKDATPKSLLTLKAELLAAATRDNAAQLKAKQAYDDRIAGIARDVQKCDAGDGAKGLALAALAGVTTQVTIRPGKERQNVVMEIKVRGLLKNDVECTVRSTATGEATPVTSTPIKVIPYRMQTITQSYHLADLDRPRTLTAAMKLKWRGLSVSVPLSATVSSTSVPRWWVIGPFNNPGGHSADLKHVIETGKLDLAKKYPGQGGQIAWRKVERGTQTHVLAEHVIDFVKLFGQRNNAAAYAVVWIDSDRAQDAMLALGSDDGLVVWLNDKVVHRNLVGRAYRSKQDRVTIHLKKGRNRLLLKVTQGNGGWSCGAHLLSTDGGFLQGVRYSLTRSP